MSEVGNDPFEQFSESLAAEAQETIEAEASIALIYERIVNALDKHQAPHIWHPDMTQLAQNREIAKSDPTAYFSHPELEVAARVIDEMTVISEASMVLTVEESRGEAVNLMPQKKGILAEAQVRGMEPEWQSALSDVLGGVSLELTDEADLQIYTERSLQSMERNVGPVGEAIEAIMRAGLEADLDVAKGDFMGNMIHLFSLMNKAHDSERHRANAEGYIQEMASQGYLSQQQAQELRQLLESE